MSIKLDVGKWGKPRDSRLEKTKERQPEPVVWTPEISQPTRLNVGTWNYRRDSRLESTLVSDPNRTVVTLIGGLGNQMFQRAFGLALETRGRDVSYNTGCCQGDHRVYSLGYFENLPLSALLDSTILEENLGFNPKYLSPGRPSTMVGFWQSEKYFEDIADKVRQIFRFKEPSPTGPASRLITEVQRAPSAFIHVRRQDYVNLQYYHGMPSLEYYQKAIELIRSIDPDVKIYVFSDDRQWCRENFSSDFYVVDGTDKYEDLQLMSLCKHAVIANSSFSWWGAWLGDAQSDRVVVAPEKWFATAGLNSQDIVPLRWNKL